MSKKVLVLVGLLALGVGAVSTIAIQSHAQKAPVQPATSVVPTANSGVTHENTLSDTDNIQNDPSGIEAPDAPVQGTQNATGQTVKQVDAQEHGEGAATDVNEVEDGN